MNKKIRDNLSIFILLFSLTPFIFSCKKDIKKTEVKKENKIEKVVFYLENSESMFGYVNGYTDYIDVVSELSEKPEFAAEITPKEFYFINGGDQLNINKLGNEPAVLKNRLSKNGFNCGNITKSNLNSMLKIALEKAQNNTVSILISDAIYDIGHPQSLLSTLVTEGNGTRSKFITRLGNSKLETLLIKLTSNFKGYYFYSSHNGKTLINQRRPFYIWIFGKSELLNKYFSEEYISKLKGYDNYARFLVYDKDAVPYQITPSINRKGDFRQDHQNKKKLNEAVSRNGEFQFSFAVDFSSLPLSENYLTMKENYTCSNSNFKVANIEKINNHQKPVVTSFKNPTHIITIYTNKNPSGILDVVLKNKVPEWLEKTNINDENHIDDKHTFGFKFLTNAISEAYENKNGEKNLAKFTIEIKK